MRIDRRSLGRNTILVIQTRQFAGKHRSHRSPNLLERGLPANQATRGFRPTASSFFAGKPGSNKHRKFLLERGLPANQATRGFRPTASSFFAGKPGSNKHRKFPLERGLPVSHAPRSIRHTASPLSRASTAPTDHRTCWSEAYPRIRRRGVSGLPRNRSSRASPAPTSTENSRWSEACP